MRYDDTHRPQRRDRVRYIGSTPRFRGLVGVVTYAWSYASAYVQWDNPPVGVSLESQVRNTSIEKIPETITTHEAWGTS